MFCYWASFFGPNFGLRKQYLPWAEYERSTLSSSLIPQHAPRFTLLGYSEKKVDFAFSCVRFVRLIFKTNVPDTKR